MRVDAAPTRSGQPYLGELVDRSEQVASLGANLFAIVRYRELLKRLVAKELKLKYRGSIFGFLWSLVNPLLMIIVYTLAFTYILRIRTEGFVFFILLGILAWTFFANSAMMCTGAVTDNAGLVKAVFFPRAILPTSTVLFNFAQYLLTTAVFLPVMLMIYDVPASGPMLLFPVFLLLQVAFTIGAGLLISTATTFFRDVRHLLEVALAVMFWTTPIVYELSMVPERMRLPILLSPMSPFVVSYQTMFYYRQWPDVTVWLVALTYAGVALTLGVWLFLKYQERFAEQL
jgi:ABC-type polysaccharide/polyol phosphate export permease